MILNFDLLSSYILSCNINEKYWNNIFNNLESKKYYTKKNELIVSKKILKKSEYLSEFNYDKKEKKINIENKIYNSKNNTILFLLEKETKIYSNKHIDKDILIYDIYILHPYHNESKFNINIEYLINSLNLNKVCIKKYSIENSNYYWEKDDDIEENNEKESTKFLFGENVKIKKDLKFYKLKNKLSLCKKIYPYMYEDKDEKDNIKYKLSKNIKIDIPKKICIENKMKIKWKFKNEYTKNILELKIKNKEIEEINNFKYFS